MPPIALKQIPRPVWHKCLKPGMRIHIASGASCPTALLEDLLPHISTIGDLEILQGLMLTPSTWANESYSENLKVNAVYLDTHLEQLVNAGMADYSPVHYSEIPALLRDGTIRLDVAMIMVSQPDAHGYCSLGTSIEWTPAAIEAADVVIAQFNKEVPKTNGQSHIHVSDIDYAIQVDSTLPILKSSSSSAAEERIAEYTSQLINDGDTLQFGVANIGTALAKALSGHRHLGIHSEVIGDGIMQLFMNGVIDNSRKSLLPGKIVCSSALGSNDLYKFVDQNPHIEFRPVDFTNNPITIAKNEQMVSVNGALMADLSGQVVVDSVRGLFRSGVGSMVDFVRGAAMSNNGRPIIAIPSTGEDSDGSFFSRIVADLPSGAGVGCNRSDIHYLVTEYGIATLRGRTIQERVQELIQVAHPDFREDLLKQARNHHLLPKYFQLPPPDKEIQHGIKTKRLYLKDNKNYLIRPLGPADDRRLQEFFYSHTEETIVRRYGFTLTRMSRERAFELVGINQNKDLALAIVELQGPRQVIHAVGRYYLDQNKCSAEMAFVVSEKKRRLGMANVLLTQMIDTATTRGLTSLWAQVDRDNAPMLTLFKKHGSTESDGDDLHTIRIEIPLNPTEQTNLN